VVLAGVDEPAERPGGRAEREGPVGAAIGVNRSERVGVMGQLGELAKKVGKEKEAGTTVSIITQKTDAERKREERIRKEEERIRMLAEAKAKSEASMKGLQKSTSKRK
jgi:hypothetical protein